MIQYYNDPQVRNSRRHRRSRRPPTDLEASHKTRLCSQLITQRLQSNSKLLALNSATPTTRTELCQKRRLTEWRSCYSYLRTPLIMRRGTSRIGMCLKLLKGPALDLSIISYCQLYTSLTREGHSSDSKIDVQSAHCVCEATLKEYIMLYDKIRVSIIR